LTLFAIEDGIKTTILSGGVFRYHPDDFTRIDDPRVLADTIMFAGTRLDSDGLPVRGVYGVTDGVVVTTYTERAGFSGASALDLSVSGDFAAYALCYDYPHCSPFGLYFSVIGGMAGNKIVAVGDALDGKTVSALRMDKQGLDDKRLAFAADFTDGSSGVFVASIPEPATAFLLMFGLLGLSATRRRRA
jgi:hypothetical protein